MESNYESHDFYYGGYNTPSSYSSGSESRESHEEYVQAPYESISETQRVESIPKAAEELGNHQTSSAKSKKSHKKRKYNSLDDIDQLIERLEKQVDPSIIGERANQILAERKEKVAQLKSLVAEARKEEKTIALLKQLEEENKEADAAIVYIKGKNGKRI